MITLYDYLPSQNGYKIRLLLKQLGQSYHTQYVSIFDREGQRPDYLAVNPTGAVPAIRLEDGRVLAESNAILTYLAEGSRYYSDDRYTRAKIQQWLSFEADYVQSTIGSLRHWVMTGKASQRPAELLSSKRAGGVKALQILDRQFAQQPFIIGEHYTIADISLFAYAQRAPEAGIMLADYPHFGRWIERVREQPDFLDEHHSYSIDPYSHRELP
jgi:glutathione S-transferase